MLQRNTTMASSRHRHLGAAFLMLTAATSAFRWHGHRGLASARVKLRARATSADQANSTKKTPQKRIVIKEPNALWREQLDGIRRMRSSHSAAVDDFGCGPLGRRGAMSDKHMRFQTLLAAMLSSQTRDEVNEGAMTRLRAASSNTIDGLKKLGEQGIAAAIKPVSFYGVKARNILLVCDILEKEYNGDVPQDMKGLLALPGVGPKMATLVMSYAWGKTVGICVDTHVHRITNRLGWVDTWRNGKGKPETTRKHLESWLPKDLWFEVNPLLVGFGQGTCSAIRPKCSSCTIAHICPASQAASSRAEERA